MSLMDKLKNAAATGLTFGWSGIKKAPSAAWWALTKSPKLFRRGFQAAAIYFTSLAAEKVLDVAHEKLPDNEFLAKADTVIHSAVNVENFLLGGAASLAKSAYESVPAKAAPVQESAQIAPPRADSDTPKPPVSLEPVTDAAKLESESIKEAKLAMPSAPFANIDSSQTVSPPPALPLTGEAPSRDAAFMPIEPAERNRANLNTAITMPVPAQPAPLPPPISPPLPAQTIIVVEPAVPVPGPEVLPVEGGYSPSIGIRIRPFERPHTESHPHFNPHIKLHFKP